MISQKTFYGDISVKIKNIRRNVANLTQQQLANAVGLSRAAIANIERGRQQILVHTLHAIAEACNVPVQSLFPESPQTKNANFDKNTVKEELKKKVSKKDARTILKKIWIQGGNHE